MTNAIIMISIAVFALLVPHLLQRSKDAMSATKLKLPNNEGVWNADLICHLIAVIHVRKGVVAISTPPYEAANMSGAIKIALAIDPDVTEVVVFSGNDVDIIYTRDKGKDWDAICFGA